MAKNQTAYANFLLEVGGSVGSSNTGFDAISSAAARRENVRAIIITAGGQTHADVAVDRDARRCRMLRRGRVAYAVRRGASRRRERRRASGEACLVKGNTRKSDGRAKRKAMRAKERHRPPLVLRNLRSFVLLRRVVFRRRRNQLTYPVD